ncbi:hypothetical protein B0T10DRAFT_484996 [Thelonectria olida]|uniref:Zn(2)-C6 fungal-type domain-containing protein n=1 Tax=Thelonectria olida TaxID=1576542 RepID=A0A9P9ATP6_9HYPO|nr:hypothetical protein B0T10DRAFT_484996 [Thelonectria olida]
MDPGPAHKRRRPAVACTECRRRKVRCDRASPCGPCSKSPLGLRCVYNNSNPSLERMQQDVFAQMSYRQSILKPSFQENMGDLDMFSMDMAYMNDDADSGFIDYLSLGIPDATNEPTDMSMTGFDNDALAWTGKGGHASRAPSSVLSSTPQLSWDSRSAAGSRLSGTSGLSSAPASSGSGAGAPGGSTNRNSDSPSPSSGSSPTDHVDAAQATPTAGERDKLWYHAFARCRRLRFLRGIVHPQLDIDAVQLPDNDAVRSLIKTFTKLDRASQRQIESRALSSHNVLGWPANMPLPAGTGRALLPPRTTCDVLLDTYINTFESVLRILHVPTLRRDYDRFWLNPASQSVDEDETFACKLMILMALGSCVCSSRHVLDDSERAQGVSLRQQARGWIAHARQWLGSKIFARADLDTAQIMCLLALARHTHQHTIPKGAVWVPGDHDLTRIGIQMGLHREPKTRFPNMSPKEAELRRRLWATMLELSLQLCFDEGLPAPISPESYDCEPPSSITDEELEVGLLLSNTPSLSKRSNYTPSIVQVLLACTQRLRLRILEMVNAPGASKAYEESHQLASELNAACHKNLDMLRSMKATNFQIKLLDVFTRPFVLALHEPFADQATSNPAYYYSRKMRMEVSALLLANPLLGVPASTSSSSLVELAGPTATSIPPGIDACAALSTQGHGHFALVQRQATAALCLDLISELEEKSFPVTDGAGWRQLRDAVRSAVCMFESRVRAAEGTHSTHEFLFFACAEAYIEAMLQGCRSRDADQAIAEAARTALAVCCEVMRRQRRGSPPGDDEEEALMWTHSDHENTMGSDGEMA